MNPCPHCFLRYSDQANPEGREDGRRWLNDTQAMNCLSRRDNSTYICGDCGRTEAMADLIFGVDHDRSEEGQLVWDQMMRLVVYSDRCEGRRMPPGIPWGPSLILTSGSVVGHDDPLEHKCDACDNRWLEGFVCTECQTISPAYLALKDHPILVAQKKSEERAVIERARSMRIAKTRARSSLVRDRVDRRINSYIYGGAARVRPCLNCQDDEYMKADDYICVRCRAELELDGNPLFAHVIARLDRLRARQ